MLGDLSIHHHLICDHLDGLLAQVHRVPDGSLQSLWSNGDKQVCGAQLDVVGWRETTDEQSWWQQNLEVSALQCCAVYQDALQV